MHEEEEEGGNPLADLLGGLGGGGGLGDLFAQAQEAMAASQQLAATEVEGSAGGGMVKVTATGGGDVLDIVIHPSVVDPDDVEGLQDLVLAALRDVNTRVAQLHQQAMGGLDPSSMLGGLDLGGIGEPDIGALGVAEDDED